MGSVKNKFGFFSQVLLGINGIIGAGIFLLPNVVAGLVGNASIWVVLICAFFAATLALCFAELAGLFSRDGGIYLYARAAFGDFVGFEVGFMRLVILTTSFAALTAGFAKVLGLSIPALSGPLAQSLIISVTLLMLAFVNIRGVDITKYFSNLTTISKLIPIAFLVIVGVFFIDPVKVMPVMPAFGDGNLASAVLVMFFAFAGFGGLTVAAADMDNPKKNIPRAILMILPIITIVYLSIQLVVTGVLGPDQLAASQVPLADAAKVFAGEFGYQLIQIGSILSLFGITVAVSFLTPRAFVGLAEDNLLPPILAKTGRYGTPVWSILIVTALATALALSGGFIYLMSLNVVARLTVYIPLCLAVLVLRKKMADQYTGFRIPFGSLVPLMGMGVCGWLVVNSPLEKILFGAGALVIGATLYFFMRWKYNDQKIGIEAIEGASE
ncbi:MAG: amino acid permease [Alphaproteobacteria bacterium]|nr:amino acid permease [Alphaproteobacteria bacterium]